MHYIDCSADIRGPYNSEWVEYPLPRLLDANESNPAVIRCNITCHDTQGWYNPAMRLMITARDGIFKHLNGMNRSIDGLYEIVYRTIMFCDGENNLLQFEYLVFPKSREMDRALITCGVVYPPTQPPCWGQDFVVIRYSSEIPQQYVTDCPTTPSSMNDLENNKNYSSESSSQSIHVNKFYTITSAVFALVIIVLPIIFI